MHAFDIGTEPIRLSKLSNGKPVIEATSISKIGYSRSHARVSVGGPTAVAVIEGRDIGLDIEPWPLKDADPDFLKSIASPEDSKVLSVLSLGGHDAGVALWVIKEAALKCTGEVMIDPRDLCVSKKQHGIFQVTSSGRARAPHPDIDVRLINLSSHSNNKPKLLVGIALGKNGHVENGLIRKVELIDREWSLILFK